MVNNARLRAHFCLNHKVVVYVPATIDVNHEIDNTKQVHETAALLSRLFGGATSADCKGFWMSNTEGLVKESTTMVFAYAGETELKNGIDEVLDFCEKLKKEMNQEAIGLEVDDQMFFI